MTIATPLLSLEAFLALPETDVAWELIDGRAVRKMSPRFRHSRTQKRLLFLLETWGGDRGFVQPEWGIALRRQGKDWVPVPDLLYVSFNRLSEQWDENVPCPVPPELAIEIVSPGQSFGAIAEKATAYLNAGVLRVWVVDPQDRSITVFSLNTMPIVYRPGEIVTDPIFPELSLKIEDVF